MVDEKFSFRDARMAIGGQGVTPHGLPPHLRGGRRSPTYLLLKYKQKMGSDRFSQKPEILNRCKAVRVFL
jgi:hypothetical protein